MPDASEMRTTAQVAEELGIHVATLRQIAGRRGLGTRIGEGRRSMLLFSPADIEQLRERRRGRPRKTLPTDTKRD
jgi:hypothetical protein